MENWWIASLFPFIHTPLFSAPFSSTPLHTNCIVRVYAHIMGSRNEGGKLQMWNTMMNLRGKFYKNKWTLILMV